MEPLVLGRSDIGFGSLTITNESVTRRRLIRRHSVAFRDVLGYRLSLAYRSDWSTMQQVFVPWWMRATRAAWNMELFAAGSRVSFNWRFDGVEVAISHVLRHIHERLTAARRAHALDGQFVQFGPLWLSKDAIRWADREPLPRDEVESVEVFDDGALRVMKRGKVLPYGKAALAALPDPMSALDVARALGYPLRGVEHVEPICAGLGIVVP